MTRHRRRAGVSALVREIRAQGDRIVGAIERASADAKVSREVMAEDVLRQGARFLRDALDVATPRTLVTDPGGPGRPRTVTLEPPVANETEVDDLPPREPAPTTLPGELAKDDELPKGRPPPASTA